MQRLNSTRLFLAQVSNHSEELSGLLGAASDTPLSADLLNRCIVSTTMLASSAYLMELSDWQTLLNSYRTLLETYSQKGLMADDKLAQVTSEVIEKEEVLIASEAEDGLSLGEVVSSVEMMAMLDELGQLIDEAGAQPSTPRPEVAKPETAPAPKVEGEDDASPMTKDADKLTSVDRPLGRSVHQLRTHVERVLGKWHDATGNASPGDGPIHENVRHDLLLVDFYAMFMEQVLNDSSMTDSAARMTPLDPVRVAIEDFAGVLCQESGRRVDVSFVGESNTVDATSLLSITKVVQCMIIDILARCDDQYLRIDVTVEKRRGSLYWTVRDNGNNFITDSRLDPDEYLAFYPRLKDASRILADLHALLWVEPNENRDTRFAFTVPLLRDGGPYVVWNAGGTSFGVRASQVCDVLAAEAMSSDRRGEFVSYAGGRVPVIRLGNLYSDAPIIGDSIAVLGCLEKRVALLVEEDGKVERGSWVKDAVPVWREMHHGGVQIEDGTIPLIEPDRLLGQYLAIVNEIEEIPGGAAGEEPDLSQTQANVEKDDASPPDNTTSSPATNEVLVLERSADLRRSFEEMLSPVKATLVDTVGAALESIRQRPPRVIISEFRVPSMGAKVLSDRLREEGWDIPILVVTSHQGTRAETLVEKLGVAGFISKPLDREEVVGRVEPFLQESPAGTER